MAYLRVTKAELEKKEEGWARPSVMELRAMLGLDPVVGVEGGGEGEGVEGREGLDEEGREALEELREWDAGAVDGRERKGEVRALGEGIKVLSVDHDYGAVQTRESGQDDSTNTIATESESTNREPEQVSLVRRARWFAASISSCTQGDEPIEIELKRCLDAISGGSSSTPIGHEYRVPLLPLVKTR